MIRSLIHSIIIISFPIALCADSWPQFRGSSGGVSKSSGPQKISAEKPLWKTAIPEGSSSPCIWDDIIFLTAGNKTNSELETLSLDRKTGAIRWRKIEKVPKLEKFHSTASPAIPTPVTDGKTLVSFFGSIGLIAYNFEGREIWRVPLPLANSHMGYGSSSSPIIIHDRVILAVALGDQSYTAAYNLTDGKEIWRTPRPLYNATWSTPVYWKEPAGDRVGLANAGRFIAYNLKDGKEVWHIDGIANQVCATPIAGDGVLYIASAGVFGDRAAITIPDDFEQMIAKHDANKDGILQFTEIPANLLFVKRGTSDGQGDMTVRRMLGFMGKDENSAFKKEDWQASRKEIIDFEQSGENKTSLIAVKTGGQGDVTATHILWNESRGIPEVPSPLLINDRIYQIKNGGILTCREAKTGKLIFEERVGAPANGGYYSSPISASDIIYLASDNGALTLLRAADKLEVIARADLKQRVQATPAIVDNTLYLRTKDYLWAFKE